MPPLLFSLLLLLTATSTVSSSPTAPTTNPCNSSPPHPLISSQLTLLLSGYSLRRLPLLRRLALSYSSHPQIHKILILWHNPRTPQPLLRPLLSLPPTVILLPLPNSSLNLRFLPHPDLIRTRLVAVSDDDLRVPPLSLSLALHAALQFPARIVGFFARSHLFDIRESRWVYSLHPDRYSIVLSKFMILDAGLLFRYSCSEEFRAAREVVERERNCEDILMNFVAGIGGGLGPVLVDGRVRDWGDPRNGGGRNGSGVVDGEGLSRRKGHRERRGECINEFHRLLGEMPLRYSYGKVVGSVGEQGVCDKGGKLVYCDRDE